MDSQHKSPLLWPLFPLVCAAFMVFPQTGYGVGENIIWQPHPWALWSYPRLINRINAHGDEFNAVALTDGERQLVIGSERGEVVVWSLAEHRVVRRFRQEGPVHALAPLSDQKEVILAGGKHAGSARSGFVRLLNVDNGTSKDFSGAGMDSIVLLAIDRAAEVIVAASATGRIVLWATKNPAPLAVWDLRQVPLGLAVAGRTVYVSSLRIEDFPKLTQEAQSDEKQSITNSILTLSADHPERPPVATPTKELKALWGSLSISPQGTSLAACRLDENLSCRTAFLTVATGKEVARFDNANSVLWVAPDRAVLFDEEAPKHLVQVNPDGVSVKEEYSGSALRERVSDSRAAWAVSRDCARAWGVFNYGAVFGTWDLRRKTDPELLMKTYTLVYAMQIRKTTQGAGLAVTGGDDGFVRIWNLRDFSLRREFQATIGVCQGAALLGDGHSLVMSFGTAETPTEIVVADGLTGAQRKLLTVKEPNVGVFPAGREFLYAGKNHVVLASPETGEMIREYQVKTQRLSVSSNGRWLAVGDEGGRLHLFEVRSGRLVLSSASTIKDLTGIVVTQDGRYVYTTEFSAVIKRWDTRQNSFRELGEQEGQCGCLRLSEDERCLVMGGNHRDFMVFDAETGEQLFREGTPDADFYVTNGWLDGNRLIFTTDLGLLNECVLHLGRGERPGPAEQKE